MLVVDSDADSRELLVFVLEEYGIKAIAASCASESLEIMQQDCPDLLISEIVLPHEDGYSLIRKVKTFESDHNVQIPAIALAACLGEGDRNQPLAAGFCRYLPKPLDIDTLIETVACVTDLTQDATMTACPPAC